MQWNDRVHPPRSEGSPSQREFIVTGSFNHQFKQIYIWQFWQIYFEICTNTSKSKEGFIVTCSSGKYEPIIKRAWNCTSLRLLLPCTGANVKINWTIFSFTFLLKDFGVTWKNQPLHVMSSSYKFYQRNPQWGSLNV